MGSGLRPLLFCVVAGIPLFACNAILGVVDVVERERKVGAFSDAGDPTPPPDELITRPEPLPDGSLPPNDVGELALGFLHGCGRTPKGTIKCWGDNGAGELGQGDDAGVDDPTVFTSALDVPAIRSGVAIASGGSHVCVVLASGEVSCWGYNFFGQVGNGSKETHSGTPSNVVGLTDAKKISAGQSFTCALRADKTVACWGINDNGQMADDSSAGHLTPSPIANVSGATAITCGAQHACVILEDKSVTCWGKNSSGESGVEGQTKILPTKVATLANIKQIAAGFDFTCALEEDGKIFCFGDNANGILGNGTLSPTTSAIPATVTGITDAVAIWAGNTHACAVHQTGTVSCWGKGDNGQVGSVPLQNYPGATVVNGVSGALQMFAGGDQSCALGGDGKAMCWGANSLGQLGIGKDDDPVPTPTPLVNFP